MINYLKKRKYYLSMLWITGFILLFPLSIRATESGAEATPGQLWISRAGNYRLSYRSELEPVPINRIHHWILHLETIDGKPVPDAQITVNGGMPAHNHGLPTRPRSTQYLGDGDYLIEGMRFHMTGYWEIILTITADSVSDTVVIPLEL
jgi:hypothetical protein